MLAGREPFLAGLKMHKDVGWRRERGALMLSQTPKSHRQLVGHAQDLPTQLLG